MMAEELKPFVAPQPGVFPHARPEDRYVGNPPSPAGSIPPATVPATPDPNALPSNVRQFEEVYEREKREMMEAPAFRGANITDRQFQQPGAPAQQIIDERERAGVAVSEKTRAEMDLGKQAIGAVVNAVTDPALSGYSGAFEGETGEQLEAKRLEQKRREEAWGKSGSIAGTVPAGGTSQAETDAEREAREARERAAREAQ